MAISSFFLHLDTMYPCLLIYKVITMLFYSLLFLLHAFTLHTVYTAFPFLSKYTIVLFFTSSLELSREFQEECYSIALHPSGLYVLVGFSDKLRLMNLLIDEIRTFKEFTIRGCREVNLCATQKFQVN